MIHFKFKIFPFHSGKSVVSKLVGLLLLLLLSRVQVAALVLVAFPDHDKFLITRKGTQIELAPLGLNIKYDSKEFGDRLIVTFYI